MMREVASTAASASLARTENSLICPPGLRVRLSVYGKTMMLSMDHLLSGSFSL